uniref:CD93 molecule n=1 Tax=Anolis carolinensis TaxID=28377 RepID=G1KWK0_ANOCA
NFLLLVALIIHPSEEAEVLCTGTACYTLDLEKHSWTKAQQMCKNNGGNLMTLKSQEEALIVQQLLNKIPQEGAGTDVEVRVWIGLHREKGKCYQQHQPLKGFVWVTGGTETKYSNWGQEPRGTCTTNRCVTIQGTPSSSQELFWADGPCSQATKGYLCKFNFQGMCRPLVLAGPVPFGSNAQHDCLDQSGGLFECSCHSGYQLGGDHLSCIPVDYCISSPCQGKCLPYPGGFTCQCSVGYMLAEDGLNCLDVDECKASSRPCEQICVNTIGSFICRCHQGYKPTEPNGQACQDIDECATLTPCDQVCLNTPGSFLCSCQTGYQLEGINSSSCIDDDECQEEFCEHMCINQPGSYQCSCRPGWILAPNKISCYPDAITSFPPTQKQELVSPENVFPASETPAMLSTSSVHVEERILVSQESTFQPNVFSSPLDAKNVVRDGYTDNNSGNSKQLLYYTLGGVAVLLLLALVLIGMAYKKMKAKKAKKTSTNAADNYSWVPDQRDTKAQSNEYI